MLSRSLYVALGDSMGISLYPELDAQARLGKSIGGLGAAALLFANNDEVWPEFRGHDLESFLPGATFLELASDAATIPTVEWQLERLRGHNAGIITLTVGGNDLLAAYFSAAGDSAMRSAVKRLSSSYQRIVERIRELAPEAILLLTTVYDPTDGTGRMPGVDGVLPIRYLHSFNDTVRATAEATANAELADVHTHFLGHGVSASPGERWYWSESIIEPSMAGASEIRRVWVEQIGTDLIWTDLTDPTD